MARVLLTGAGGFIGANLARALLARGDEVHACVRSPRDAWRLAGLDRRLTLHTTDFTDAASIRSVVAAVRPELVYHLAHYGGNRGQEDASLIRRTIIDGTAHLYDACAEYDPFIVHAGSSSEYGTKTEPMREDMLPEPTTEYGLAKLWATLHGERLRREMGAKITTLRLFSVYGPYEARTRLIPATTLAFLSGTVPPLSNKDTARDFVYVGDVCDAFLLAPSRPCGVYNIGTGIESTLERAVELIRTEAGSSLPLAWGTMDGRVFDTAHWVADTTKTSRELGWTPSISLADGIRSTVAWFTEHRSLYA